METPKRIYGRDFKFGDRITVEFDGAWINTRVSTVDVTVEGGRETVKCRCETNIGDYEVEVYEPGAPPAPTTLCGSPWTGSIYAPEEDETYDAFTDSIRILVAWLGQTTRNQTKSGSGSSAFGINFTGNPRDFYVTNMVINLSYSVTQDMGNYWQIDRANEISSSLPVDDTQSNPTSLTVTTDFAFSTSNTNHLRFTPIGSPGTLTVTSVVIDYQRIEVCQYDT